MEHERIAEDLEFIKKVIETSLKYKIIPSPAYLTAGALGLIGPLISYLYLGADKAGSLRGLSGLDLVGLGALWTLVLALALAAGVYFTVERSRKLKVRSWNSLSTRMFLSQLPQIAVFGILTLVLAANGLCRLIPAVWLLGWGLILFSFHYFTGAEHLILSLIFLALGALAMLCSGGAGLVLLGLGFGLAHLVFGARRLLAGGDSP